MEVDNLDKCYKIYNYVNASLTITQIKYLKKIKTYQKYGDLI